MPVSINNNKKLIAVGDVEPSALDLTRHMLSGEEISSVTVLAGPGLSITSAGAIGGAYSKTKSGVSRGFRRVFRRKTKTEEIEEDSETES